MPRSRSSSASNVVMKNQGGILMILCFSVPVICAILAKFGMIGGREHVIGIDLGTTYSVVGVKRSDSSDVITIISDSNGNKLIPSVVSFLPSGETIVGHDAKEYSVTDPVNTIFNAKRFIGRPYDTTLASQASAYDYKVVQQDDSSEVCFQVQSSCVSPIQVGTVIVNHLQSMTRAFLKHSQVTTAVIAVPADFNTRQREATRTAVEASGLRVARILDEPTAAAIAYGLDLIPSVNYVLVFDFGGGTLDVSILYIVQKAVTVIGKGGDNQLGGEDLDTKLYEYLRQEFVALLGEDIAVTEVSSSNKTYPCTTAGLRRVAETVKRRLSTNFETTAECIVHHDTKSGVKSGSILKLSVTRKSFESICKELLERSMTVVTNVLTQTDMMQSEVDEVVMVGGSSRIPWLHQRLKKMFGQDPHADIDPDIAVAYGAARVVD